MNATGKPTLPMRQPIFRRASTRWFLFVAIAGTSLAAEAYVGPGAGLSLLSALWGLLCAIGAAFLFVIMWPIRRLRRRRAEKKKAADPSNPAMSRDQQETTAGDHEPPSPDFADSSPDDHRPS